MLRNGVDMSVYAPIEQTQARAVLGLTHGPRGRVCWQPDSRQGTRSGVQSIARLDDVVLLVVGDGPQRASLERLARELGIGSRVQFTGELLPEQMPTVYSAADLLVLASSNEGWPNVVLEAMACGAAVVAADVGGVREILTAGVGGTIVAGTLG